MPVYHCHKPVFRPKKANFRREGGLPLPLAFQYLIFMVCRACDLNLVMISLLASKWQDFKHIIFYKTTLKTCYFEASEDIMTKFKSQALHFIRIKY